MTTDSQIENVLKVLADERIPNWDIYSDSETSIANFGESNSTQDSNFQPLRDEEYVSPTATHIEYMEETYSFEEQQSTHNETLTPTPTLVATPEQEQTFSTSPAPRFPPSSSSGHSIDLSGYTIEINNDENSLDNTGMYLTFVPPPNYETAIDHPPPAYYYRPPINSHTLHARQHQTQPQTPADQYIVTNSDNNNNANDHPQPHQQQSTSVSNTVTTSFLTTTDTATSDQQERYRPSTSQQQQPQQQPSPQQIVQAKKKKRRKARRNAFAMFLGSMDFDCAPSNDYYPHTGTTTTHANRDYHHHRHCSHTRRQNQSHHAAEINGQTNVIPRRPPPAVLLPLYRQSLSLTMSRPFPSSYPVPLGSIEEEDNEAYHCSCHQLRSSTATTNDAGNVYDNRNTNRNINGHNLDLENGEIADEDVSPGAARMTKYLLGIVLSLCFAVLGLLILVEVKFL